MRIAQLHQPKRSMMNHLSKMCDLPTTSGAHDRPKDPRVLSCLHELQEANIFSLQPGRFFPGHPIMPRSILTWNDPAKFSKWIEGHIDTLGTYLLLQYIVVCFEIAVIFS